MKRNTDDVFVLWQDTEIRLLELFGYVKKVHWTMKFDNELLGTKIKFLDVKLKMNSQYLWDTDIYPKNQWTCTLTSIGSLHTHLRISISYGQVLCLCRTCSNDNVLREKLKGYCLFWEAPCYKRDLVEKEMKKGWRLFRKQRNTEKQVSNRTVFITTLNANPRRFGELGIKRLTILHSKTRRKMKVFQHPKLKVDQGAYRTY